MRLTLRVDDRSLVVMPEDVLTVAGVEVHGGRETLEALRAAVFAGIDPIDLTKAKDQTALTIDLRKRDVDAASAEKSGWKLGIEPWGRPKILAVRGAAAGLHDGDEVLTAEVAEGRTVDVDSPSRWDALRFAPSLRRLEVQRGKDRVWIDVGAETTPAVAAFLRDVHGVVERTTRVRPSGPAPYSNLEDDGIVHHDRVPALDAGLQPGDRIFKIATTTVEEWNDVAAAVAGLSTAGPVDVWVRRADAEHRLSMQLLRPARHRGIAIEATPLSEVVVPEGFVAAVPIAARRTVREIQNVFRTIGSFFAGSISFNKNIGGPVQLVAMSGSAAKSSWQMFFVFLAYISVSLAVLNILPIPVLDGGHLLFILLEKIKGAPLQEATIAKFQMVGLVLILLLLGFALKNDISFLVSPRG
jgi:RIP metalloprotease RseP